MSEAWPNSREASKSVAFTSSTVAPVERKGGMKRVDRRRRRKFTTRRSREKRETRSERLLYGGNMWSQVRRRDWHRKTSYTDRPKSEMAFWEVFFFSPLSSAAPIRSIRCHSSEWVYGLMDYQRTWHRPFLAQAWSISWQGEGWGASQSRRASSQLSLSTPRAGPSTLAIFNSLKPPPDPRRSSALICVHSRTQKVDSVCLSL